MRYKILSLVALVAMTACGVFILFYRFAHPHRAALRVLFRRWPLFLGIVLFALLAVLGWLRHQHNRTRQDD